MLRATRRLLRPGGRTAFTTIHLPVGLSPAKRREAVEAGPAAVATRSRDHLTLLGSAGFVDVEQVDLTAAYRGTLQRWLWHARALADDLAPLEPPGRFEEGLEERAATLAALDAGLLRRSMFAAGRRKVVRRSDRRRPGNRPPGRHAPRRAPATGRSPSGSDVRRIRARPAA